jgi:hypothetical protein
MSSSPYPKAASTVPSCGTELGEMQAPYRVHYLEEHPEWVDPFGIKGSPNVIVSYAPI